MYLYIKYRICIMNNKRKGGLYTGGLYSGVLIFGWKNTLRTWGAYIRGSLHTLTYAFLTSKHKFSKVPMWFLTLSHIHILFALLIKKNPQKIGKQGPNLNIFLWHLKSELKKKNFKISNLKKSVCLQKWRLNLKQKIKP